MRYDLILSGLSDRARRIDDAITARGGSATPQEQHDLDEIHAEFQRIEAEARKPLPRIADPNDPGSRPGMFSGPGPGGPQVWGVTKSGERLRIFAKGEKLADHFRGSGETWGIGDFLRANMGLPVMNQSIIERSPATVPLTISSRIVDMMREKSRLLQAGAITIPTSGPTNLAKITSDPVVYRHTEAVDDVGESAPTFAPVSLDPGTLATRVPVSLEAVEDSPNLDAALMTSISGAFANELDKIGVEKLLADEGIDNSSDNPGTWPGVMAGLGEHLLNNGPFPTALVCHPSDWTARHSATASESGVWLGPPPALAGMLDLETSKMIYGTAVFGRFDLGLCLAIRSDLRIETLRFAKPGHVSHVLMVTMRAEFYVLQPAALFVIGFSES
jgi:hypothetical protein